MSLKPVLGTELLKNTKTNSILNISESDYAEFKKRKKISQMKQNSQKKDGDRLNKLEQDVAELKSLIKSLLDTVAK